LGGQLITPVKQSRPPFWVWNTGLNQLYMSSYHLSANFAPHYLEALAKYSIKYLWGYSSSLHALAYEALRLNWQLNLDVVITNAEPLFPYQREVIANAFNCPVRETYGMCEMVAAASECESNRMHLWPEVGKIEVLDSATSASGRDLGDLICTSLLNDDMPLIRYRVGDTGALSTHYDICSCGRLLPPISSIEGRIDDLLYTADGRVVGRLDPVFKGNLPVKAAQIIQETLNQIRVRYIPGNDFDNDAAESLIRQITARMGEVNVILEQVENISPQANGKFRAVICKLSPQERNAINAYSKTSGSAAPLSIAGLVR